MHSTFHIALGIIIASITHIFYPLNFWSYGFIVFCAFGVDFDIFLGRFLEESNHRMFFTHSLIIPAVGLLMGFLFDWVWLIMGAISYLSHLIFDMVDWSINLWYFQKIPVGLMLLWKKSGKIDIDKKMKEHKNPSWFFNKLYYSHFLIVFLEVLAFVTMILLIFIYTIEFWYFLLAYFALFLIHMVDYFESKRRFHGHDPRFRQIRGN